MDRFANSAQFTTALKVLLDYASMPNPSRKVVASRLQELSCRVAGTTRLGFSGDPLYGHDNPNNAYEVDDYPYGRNLRCKIRYWLESSPNKGYRFVSQTQDPRTGRWNNPKKSTYALLGANMYLDSKNHVVWSQISEYSKAGEILEFVRSFPQSDFSILKKFAPKKIAYLKASAEGRVVWKINGVPQPPKEEDMGEARKELEVWEDIARYIH
jgi:hypothetical protein